MSLNGKVAIITGGNSGIGKATALALAEMGANVIIICRDYNRGVSTINAAKEKTGNSSAELILADLSSKTAITQMVEKFKENHSQLHILVNNAGVFLGKRMLTADGLEATFATNHMSYFLVSRGLLDVLTRSAPSRIINVSSAAHRGATINFDDLQGESKYSGFRAYSRSKLANILYTYELAHRLQKTKVTVNCLHPGAVYTNLMRGAPMIAKVAWKVLWPFLASSEKGARTPIFLASSPDVEGVTGKYFENRREARSSVQSYDAEARHLLWQVSERIAS